MDLDWCLVCDKRSREGSLYCSSTCQALDAQNKQETQKDVQEDEITQPVPKLERKHSLLHHLGDVKNYAESLAIQLVNYANPLRFLWNQDDIPRPKSVQLEESLPKSLTRSKSDLSTSLPPHSSQHPMQSNIPTRSSSALRMALQDLVRGTWSPRLKISSPKESPKNVEFLSPPSPKNQAQRLIARWNGISEDDVQKFLSKSLDSNVSV